jgi:hypothetical protein
LLLFSSYFPVEFFSKSLFKVFTKFSSKKFHEVFLSNFVSKIFLLNFYVLEYFHNFSHKTFVLYFSICFWPVGKGAEDQRVMDHVAAPQADTGRIDRRERSLRSPVNLTPPSSTLLVSMFGLIIHPRAFITPSL